MKTNITVVLLDNGMNNSVRNATLFRECFYKYEHYSDYYPQLNDIVHCRTILLWMGDNREGTMKRTDCRIKCNYRDRYNNNNVMEWDKL